MMLLTVYSRHQNVMNQSEPKGTRPMERNRFIPKHGLVFLARKSCDFSLQCPIQIISLYVTPDPYLGFEPITARPKVERSHHGGCFKKVVTIDKINMTIRPKCYET